MNERPLVVDASVAVKWLIPEPGRAAAVELLDAWLARKVELIAPSLMMTEVANTLSKRCRQNFMDPATAQQLFDVFESNAPALMESPNQLRLALTLSLRHRISLWDSVYLALAIERTADLITADQRFYRSVARHYPFVRMLVGAYSGS
jgi:predicted nucleic acid-binding protein